MGHRNVVIAGHSGIKFEFASGTIMQLSDNIIEKKHGVFFDNYFISCLHLQYLGLPSNFLIGIRIKIFYSPQ